MPALLILALSATGHAQVVVVGYLTTGPDPVTIDSTCLRHGSDSTWFATPGWHAEPTTTDTFVFPSFSGFPTNVQLAADFSGTSTTGTQESRPSDVVCVRPARDLTKAMFDGPAVH